MITGVLADKIMLSLQLTLYLMAGFLYFRHCGNTLAESAAYTIMAWLVMLSCLWQFELFIGWGWAGRGGEIFLAILSGGGMIRYRGHLLETLRIFRQFSRQHRAFMLILLSACGYLLLQALFLEPTANHWDQLARIILYRQTGGLIGQEMAESASILIMPNSLILPDLMLRRGLSWGVSVFGFLAYLVIIFSTYALARRYAWPKTAGIATLIVATMPRIVLQAATPGAELIPAAAAIFCLLALNRSLEQPCFRDIAWIFLSLAFGLSHSLPSLLFPVIALFLTIFLLFRRHGIEGVLAAAGGWKLILLLIPLSLLLQLPVWIWAGAWPGLRIDYPENLGNLPGAIANFIRYFMSSLHLTEPFHDFCRWALHINVVGFIERCGQFLSRPFLPQPPTESFAISWIPQETRLWFGPFSCFLILPSLALALVSGHRRMKAIAIGLISYICLISLLADWRPEHVRFFTVFFVCAGFFTAFLLPPWRLTATGVAVIQALSLLLFLHTALFNLDKPLFRFERSLSFQNSDAVSGNVGSMVIKAFKQGIWGKTGTADQENLRHTISLAADLPLNAAVGLVGTDFANVYPYLRLRPDLRFVILTDSATPKTKPQWIMRLGSGASSPTLPPIIEPFK